MLGLFRRAVNRDFERDMDVGSVLKVPKRPRRKPPSRAVLRGASEVQLERFVIAAARLHGWCGFHVSFSHGSVTGVHVMGLGDGHYDSDGWPDWVFVRGTRILFRELKGLGKYQTPAQKRWQAMLVAAGQDCKVWKPNDQEEILATFRGD